MGRLAFLYRNSSFLDFYCRRILCLSLIQPYLEYCSSSWYSGITAHLSSRLDVLQRKMARFVFSLENRAHIGTAELRSLSWLTISAEDWAEFEVTWEQYKEEYSLAGPALIRQLYACCADELKQGLSRLTGGGQFGLTETNLLKMIKQLAVRYQNPAVHVQEFLSLLYPVRYQADVVSII